MNSLDIKSSKVFSSTLLTSKAIDQTIPDDLKVSFINQSLLLQDIADTYVVKIEAILKNFSLFKRDLKLRTVSIKKHLYNYRASLFEGLTKSQVLEMSDFMDDRYSEIEPILNQLYFCFYKNLGKSINDSTIHHKSFESNSTELIKLIAYLSIAHIATQVANKLIDDLNSRCTMSGVNIKPFQYDHNMVSVHNHLSKFYNHFSQFLGSVSIDINKFSDIQPVFDLFAKRVVDVCSPVGV